MRFETARPRALRLELNSSTEGACIRQVGRLACQSQSFMMPGINNKFNYSLVIILMRVTYTRMLIREGGGEYLDIYVYEYIMRTCYVMQCVKFFRGEKNVTKVYGSMVSALRGGGGVSNSQEKSIT